MQSTLFELFKESLQVILWHLSHVPGRGVVFANFVSMMGNQNWKVIHRQVSFLDLHMPSLSSYTMPKPNICYKGHVVPISFLLFLTVLKRIRGGGSACGLETLRETDFGDRGSSTAYSNT